MVILQSTKIQRVIQNTSYKLAEIIRDTCHTTFLLKNGETMNEKAERINGWAAMIGVIADG